ncbi:efflux transporter periplasmic adaptor subunit [Vibrio navarrensis]|uniref:efflux RND transporter periplasmic adaptor subunit n=1 Tax=Vibrio navarrensis TaxID=29495 RepID=UPI00186A5139|nr:efflux RND transporter periplasmic adaptor subunit [Vibrio navarrensis]MBE3668665.1 efflux transporter periplasmic adaptor subunit [Vibrio navarrensis]MBE4592580.1 efflux transporter periplasmic adaptor subunit [Vibrio navarrensis]
MNKRILISMLVLTLSGHSSLASTAPKGPTAVTVVAEQVQTHQINQSLSLVGKLEAVQSVVIASEVSGKVESIQVKANQNVRQGQLLIKLEDDKALAAQTEANAYLKDEQRKLKEYERLVKRNAITQTEIDAQKASVEIAEARLAAAKASLNDLHISAPFAGTVGFINFSRGKLVSAGTELLTLDDLSLMQLDLHIPERYLSQVSLGMAVTASSNAWKNETFQGKIVGIDSRINAETLNLRVRIQFANPENKLKPGMLLNTALAFPAIEAPIIPVQALEYSGTKRYVYVIDENNKARRTEVLLGARVENQVVIESGVNIGDKIVVQGIVNMRDGVLVKELGSANNAQPETKKDS